jgi:hypothetical protein
MVTMESVAEAVALEAESRGELPGFVVEPESF